MSVLTFVIASFAIYRLARMIAEEEGPRAIFSDLRGAIDPDQRTWLGRGMNCALCIGFWLALPAALLVSTDWLLWWLGLAGAAAWLYRLER